MLVMGGRLVAKWANTLEMKTQGMIVNGYLGQTINDLFRSLSPMVFY